MDSLPEDIREYFRRKGAEGGKERARRHTTEELSAWGKMGGRPKGAGKNKAGRKNPKKAK
jgi:hypothetical protein